MSCCCTKTYKFCTKISGCNVSNIAYLFKGIPDGSYIVELNYLSGIIRAIMSVTAGVFTVSGPELNENYTYTGRLFTSTGGAFNFMVNSIAYDCFLFETINVLGYLGDMNSGQASEIITIGDVVEAIHWYSVVGEIPVGLINGINATFTTAFAFQPNSTAVYVNGILQENGVHYHTVGTQTIVFTDSPITGDIIEVDYIKI